MNAITVEYIAKKLNLKYVMFDEEKGTASIVVDDSELVEISMDLFFKLFKEKEENCENLEEKQENFLEAQKYLRNLISTMKTNGYEPEEIIDYIINTVQLKNENVAEYREFIEKTVDQLFKAA